MIAENIVPEVDFPFGPYPGNILTRFSDNDVAFETPPDREGMGTDSQLIKNNGPIMGEPIFGADGTTVAVVRLPVGLRYLSSVILSQVRRVAASENKG